MSSQAAAMKNRKGDGSMNARANQQRESPTHVQPTQSFGRPRNRSMRLRGFGSITLLTLPDAVPVGGDAGMVTVGPRARPCCRCCLARLQAYDRRSATGTGEAANFRESITGCTTMLR